MIDKSDLIISGLQKYIKENDYSGYDPFDALNVRLLRNIGLFRCNSFKLFWTQFNKWSPLNLRPIFLAPKSFNPKGGALSLLALINLYKAGREEAHGDDMEKLLEKILSAGVRTAKGMGFGYDFEWQARAFSVPPYAPNTVVSVYVARALLEYSRNFGDGLSPVLQGIRDFLVYENVIFEDTGNMCFGYVPGKDACVHNVNLMAAAFLSEHYKLTGGTDGELKGKIRKAVSFSIADINKDFSWPYGTKPFHRWVDNFHTAFNIESLLTIRSVFPELGLDDVISGVAGYYLSGLFEKEGTPKYYNNSLYPIDVHVLAEAKIVMNILLKEKNIKGIDLSRVKEIAAKNDEWISRFWSGKEYFYYRKNKFYWNRVPYMRWGQAWMFYALSTDLLLD